MKKSLNICLVISFIMTIMEPVTGIGIHKMAAAMFLVLSLIHIAVYRKKADFKRWLLLVIILLSFFSGCAGMIWEQLPVFSKLHRAVSIAAVFFLAIHIFRFRRALSDKPFPDRDPAR